jgi:hypothetical protein
MHASIARRFDGKIGASHECLMERNEKIANQLLWLLITLPPLDYLATHQLLEFANPSITFYKVAWDLSGVKWQFLIRYIKMAISPWSYRFGKNASFIENAYSWTLGIWAMRRHILLTRAEGPKQRPGPKTPSPRDGRRWRPSSSPRRRSGSRLTAARQPCAPPPFPSTVTGFARTGDPSIRISHWFPVLVRNPNMLRFRGWVLFWAIVGDEIRNLPSSPAFTSGPINYSLLILFLMNLFLSARKRNLDWWRSN